MLYITIIPIYIENTLNHKYIQNSKLTITQCIADNQYHAVALKIQIMY